MSDNVSTSSDLWLQRPGWGAVPQVPIHLYSWGNGWLESGSVCLAIATDGSSYLASLDGTPLYWGTVGLYTWRPETMPLDVDPSDAL